MKKRRIIILSLAAFLLVCFFAGYFIKESHKRGLQSLSSVSASDIKEISYLYGRNTVLLSDEDKNMVIGYLKNLKLEKKTDYSAAEGADGEDGHNFYIELKSGDTIITNDFFNCYSINNTTYYKETENTEDYEKLRAIALAYKDKLYKEKGWT